MSTAYAAASILFATPLVTAVLLVVPARPGWRSAWNCSASVSSSAVASCTWT